MPHADESTLRQLRDAVRAASARPDVRDAVEQVYRELADEVARRRPLCVVSGRCCRFEEYGHRLFVTTGELATFLHGLQQGGQPGMGGRASVRAAGSTGGAALAARKDGSDGASPSRSLPLAVTTWDGTGCPFQVARLCGVHALRPFGCRIFFCDATATRWQNDAYETFHARLKHLHEQLDLPYFYIEWRQALRALIPELGPGGTT